MEWVVGIVVALVAIWVAFLVIFWLARPRGVATRDVLAVIPDLVRLLRDVATDRSAPIFVRLVLVGLLAWILSPIDLIPEVIPVLGPIDDIVVAVVALRYVRRRLGAESLRRRWRGSDAGFELLLRVIG
ncbi:MAG: DUF1232 domain-containing protein [Chloroflexi bacterium]|nr:DUF1232 domain-containing protein [Chloroflexota bacterium]